MAPGKEQGADAAVQAKRARLLKKLSDLTSFQQPAVRVVHGSQSRRQRRT